MLEYRSGETSNEPTVRLSTEVPLPSLIRTMLADTGARLLHRHRHRFGSAELHVHIKRAGSGLRCMAHLSTDDGNYHAHAEEWDVRRCIDRALDMLDAQVLKVFDRRVTLVGA